MHDLKSVLKLAAGEGIISAEQAEKLVPYLAGQGVGLSGLAKPADRPIEPEEPRSAVADTESPRFVRGFHDILITIGVVIALLGSWGIGSVFAALAAMIILAEILVRRQRLALPAVALTVAFTYWIGASTALFLDGKVDGLDGITVVLIAILPFPILLAAFYWRYRVPLSLAATLASTLAAFMAFVLYLLSKATGSSDFLLSHNQLALSIILAAAIALFVLAMRFDLKDPNRLTRDADVAFWLHLATAPALLYAVLSFIFLNKNGSPSFIASDANLNLSDAFIVIAVVVALMLVGLVIDRRAFVTSGLVSLGAAIARLFQESGADLSGYIYVILLIVGAVVLVIGVGWSYFRAAALDLLPEALRSRLPPVR